MTQFLAAVLLTICMNLGVALRYVTFAPIVNSKQKKTLFLVYGILACANLIFITIAMHIFGARAAFEYLRFGGIIYASVMTLVNILVIRKKTQEHLFVAGIVISCNYLLMSIPNYVITFLKYLDAQTILLVILPLYTGVLLLTHWPLRKLLRYSVTPFLGNDSENYWKTIWFIPIAFFGTKFINLGGEHNTGGVIQLISSALYIVVIVMICLSTASGQRRMNEQQLMEKQLASQNLHYQNLKDKVEAARKTRHDFKHYVAAIRRYIELDDKTSLQNYFDELANSMVSDEIPYTGNLAADGIIYHYIQNSRQEGINFSYSGIIRSNGILDMDLCVLLGNALDNALTGCLTIPKDRSIQLICQSEKQVLSILVRNTFDGKVIQTNGEFKSRKSEGRIGVGMHSMSSVCSRYGGTMETVWDEKYFSVMFILPITPE